MEFCGGVGGGPLKSHYELVSSSAANSFVYIYTPRHLKGKICQNVSISGQRPGEGKACFDERRCLWGYGIILRKLWRLTNLVVSHIYTADKVHTDRRSRLWSDPSCLMASHWQKLSSAHARSRKYRGVSRDLPLHRRKSMAKKKVLKNLRVFPKLSDNEILLEELWEHLSWSAKKGMLRKGTEKNRGWDHQAAKEAWWFKSNFAGSSSKISPDQAYSSPFLRKSCPHVKSVRIHLD